MLYALLIELAIVGLVNITLWLRIKCFPVRVVRVKRLYLGAKGLALPGYIFLTEAAANETVLRHEIVHQKQMLRYTPLGVAIYLGWHYGKGIVSHYMQHGRLPRFVDLWATNPLEVEANSLMCSKAPLPRVSGWPFPK